MEPMITGSIGARVDSASTSTAASAMAGNDITMSSVRMRTSEIHLRAVAATEPSTAATTSAMPVAERPTSMDTRAP